MKKAILFMLVCMTSLMINAQEALNGNYFNEDFKISLKVNLAEKTIKAPDLDDFDECYGYFEGNINGVWVIMKIKDNKGGKVTVRAISDRGYDAQDMLIKMIDEETFEFSLLTEQNMKGIKDNKYAKLPKVLTFKKK